METHAQVPWLPGHLWAIFKFCERAEILMDFVVKMAERHRDN